MKKGSFIVETLVALLIIAMAVGIAIVSTGNLLKKSLENRHLIELSNILLNETETLTFMDVSLIPTGTSKITYNDREYTIEITKEIENLEDMIYMVSNNQNIIFSDIVVVKVRVTAPDGKYIETRVVPQQ
ncbi:hypothetical protein [Thermosipho atlanticus]|uniref:Prepilin-type N-terminal cleavage/methylation domain-containing protein n=1 Tax=Thermosipho atlanticus DSM 15807 TaxID=1123380 RepID=A0A1M5RRT8_9BACT|nr:hypothetical protein [Thermosipho atlanticus]SHH28987.1 hypothetical protein SAMN02745199_0584 [Thermosipho atlanticus DSM 15807]